MRRLQFQAEIALKERLYHFTFKVMLYLMLYRFSRRISSYSKLWHAEFYALKKFRVDIPF
jgi:hypothetical protein